MRLLRLDIRGFGQLQGRIDLDPGDGHVGLVIERNEAGKSTLAAALLAALYGLDGDRRRFRGTITDLDRFRPWHQGEYGLTLHLSHRGEELLVDRDFAQGTVRVLRGAEDVTDRFRQGTSVAVGETLTGLRREQFVASVFVGQGDVAWRDPEQLTEALQRVADSSSGSTTSDRAIAALERALDKYPGTTLAGPGKVTTEIKRCEDALATARAELADLDRRQSELEPRIVALESALVDEQHDERERAILRLRRLRTEEAAVRSVLAQDDELALRIGELRAQVDPFAQADTRLEAQRVQLNAGRRRLDLVRQDIATHQREIEQAQADLDREREQLDAVGLAHVPTADETERLQDALHTLFEAVREHEDFLRRLDTDRAELTERGSSVREAADLTQVFEGLTDADRVLLVGRSSRHGDREDRRRELESSIDRSRRTLDVVARAQDSRRRRGWITLAVAGVLAGLVLVYGGKVPVPIGLLLGLPSALAAFGLFLAVQGSRHREGEIAVAHATIESAAAALDDLSVEEADEQTRWSEFAVRLDVPADRLEERYAQWSRVEHLARRAVVHRERADGWRETRTDALDRLREFEDLFGESATEERARDWMELARRAQARAERVTEQEHRLANRDDEQRVRRESLASIEEELRTQLVDLLGLDPGIDLGAAFERFDTALDAARARTEIRDHRLPLMADRRLDPARRQAHERRLDVVIEECTALEARVGAVDDAPLTETDYESALSAIEARARARQERIESTRITVQSFVREYESRAPVLRESIEEHERALTRAVEYRAAVELARDTLRDLAQQTHVVWAAALERAAGRFLHSMGSEVDEIRFDEHLGLRVHQQGRVLTGDEARRVLSAGALDTVFLASRFAVARFLAADDAPLPLVLDDPLANADDERLLATLRLLIEGVAPEQQVLLLACQQSRYDWAASRLGDGDTLRPLRLSTDDRDPVAG